jgi:predicted nucleic acid-binding protein
MTGSRLSYVVDTNIWIDLHFADLLVVVLRMPFDWLTPDLVVEELTKTTSQMIGLMLREHGVQERALSPDQVRDAARLAVLYRHPSRVDLLSLALAKSLGVALLTGDRRLREAAEQERVVVHGVLWLLDQSIAGQTLTKAEATAALSQMLAAGSRLPREEVEERLRQWRKD